MTTFGPSSGRIVCTTISGAPRRHCRENSSRACIRPSQSSVGRSTCDTCSFSPLFDVSSMSPSRIARAHRHGVLGEALVVRHQRDAAVPLAPGGHRRDVRQLELRLLEHRLERHLRGVDAAAHLHVHQLHRLDAAVVGVAHHRLHEADRHVGDRHRVPLLRRRRHERLPLVRRRHQLREARDVRRALLVGADRALSAPEADADAAKAARRIAQRMASGRCRRGRRKKIASIRNPEEISLSEPRAASALRALGAPARTALSARAPPRAPRRARSGALSARPGVAGSSLSAARRRAAHTPAKLRPLTIARPTAAGPPHLPRTMSNQDIEYSEKYFDDDFEYRRARRRRRRAAARPRAPSPRARAPTRIPPRHTRISPISSAAPRPAQARHPPEARRQKRAEGAAAAGAGVARPRRAAVARLGALRRPQAGAAHPALPPPERHRPHDGPRRGQAHRPHHRQGPLSLRHGAAAVRLLPVVRGGPPPRLPR